MRYKRFIKGGSVVKFVEHFLWTPPLLMNSFDLTCVHSLQIEVLLQPLLWHQFWVGFNHSGGNNLTIPCLIFIVQASVWPSTLGPLYCCWNAILWGPLAPTYGAKFSSMGDRSWQIQFFLFLLQHWLFGEGVVVHMNFHTTVVGGIKDQLHLIPIGAQILSWDLLSGKLWLRYHITNIW